MRPPLPIDFREGNHASAALGHAENSPKSSGKLSHGPVAMPNNEVATSLLLPHYNRPLRSCR